MSARAHVLVSACVCGWVSECVYVCLSVCVGGDVSVCLSVRVCDRA